MIVEFVGLPGAGKTTLCEGLREALGVPGALATETREGSRRGFVRTARTCLAIVRYWRPLELGISALARSDRRWQEKRMALRLLVVSLRVYVGRQRRSPLDHLVLQEGILQRAFLLFLEANGMASPRAIQVWARSIPLPDILIALEVAPSIALSRLAERARPVPRRFAALPAHDLLRIFGQGAEVLSLTIKAAEQQPNTSMTIIRIDTTTLEPVARELSARVAEEISRSLPAHLQGKVVDRWRRRGRRE